MRLLFARGWRRIVPLPVPRAPTMPMPRLPSSAVFYPYPPFLCWCFRRDRCGRNEADGGVELGHEQVDRLDLRQRDFWPSDEP